MIINLTKETVKKIGIYQIRNISNNKVYIGSTISGFKKRITEHLYLLNSNTHHSQVLQRAYNKYGNDNFEFTILEVCDREIIIKQEQYWLDFKKSYNRDFGYNILSKAYNSEGYKHTEENIKLIGEMSKKRGCNMNSIKAMQKANLGGKRDKVHSDRMSKLHSKPVIQLDLKGNYIKRWDNCTQATLFYGMSPKNSNIAGCTRGKIKSCKGFMWIKEEDYDKSNIYTYKPIINGVK